MPKKTLQAFEAEATQIGECLVHPGRAYHAAKACFVLRHGKLPIRACVCHTCDNPKCIRDEHHFVGTYKENTADAREKGRLGKGNIGKKRSQEARLKMSQAAKGRELSPETVAKIVAQNTGLKRTPEQRERMGVPRRGVPFTEQHKENLRIASRRRWDKAKKEK